METRITSDHNKIKQWAEERNARPACYKCSNGNSLLMFCFPGETEMAVAKLSWEDFFKKFEELNLAFLYQERNIHGKKSRFNSFISKEAIKYRLMKKPG
ncbi:MAG TPA: hypothetical protein VIK89_05040 [Cytophagaceae bacterium]